MATNVFPSPVFISAMSPSWRTMPPISWTSKMPLVGLALARLAHGGERLEEEVVERLAVLEPLPELDRLRGELVVGELLEVGLERRDVGRLLGEPLDPPALADAQDLLEGAEVLTGHRLQGSRSARAPRMDGAVRSAR